MALLPLLGHPRSDCRLDPISRRQLRCRSTQSSLASPPQDRLETPAPTGSSYQIVIVDESWSADRTDSLLSPFAGGSITISTRTWNTPVSRSVSTRSKVSTSPLREFPAVATTFSAVPAWVFPSASVTSIRTVSRSPYRLSNSCTTRVVAKATSEIPLGCNAERFLVIDGENSYELFQTQESSNTVGLTTLQASCPQNR